MMNRAVLILIGMGVFGSMVPRSCEGTAPDPSVSQRIKFESRVGNVEYAASVLRYSAPPSVRGVPTTNGKMWFGVIRRRLPSDRLWEEKHNVAFAVEYAAGHPRHVWCDQNLDGDLSNDAVVVLMDHPMGARAFLVDLTWRIETGGIEQTIEWKIRVVLEPAPGPEARPLFHEQRVFVPVGMVVLGDVAHRAFLYDGNCDGLYTAEPLDGMFVDLNDDRHFEVDPFSPEFASFRAPAQLGTFVCDLEPIGSEGTEVALKIVGVSSPVIPARIGSPVPEFALRDVDGRSFAAGSLRGRAVIVYFWASWCSTCRTQAPALVDIYRRYPRTRLEILGVSYDSDVAEMQGFRREHDESWPSSFTGGVASEDPIGRLFQESGAGVLYLIDRAGIVTGVFYDVPSLAAALAKVLSY